MKIIEHPSPNHSARPVGQRVDTIVIHHTASSDAHSALSWMKNPESKVSAHYLIGAYGHVYRLVPENRTAWHAGESCMPWEKMKKGASVNARSIGVELVNPGDGHTPFTEAQYRSLGELLPDICRRLDWARVYVGQDFCVRVPGQDVVSVAHGFILGHRDVAPGRKTDPADNFDWGRVREMLKARTS